MRRSEKSWLEFDELTRPFLEPGSEESVTSVAVELRDRMVKVEQQVLAQYTATAAYATLAQQGVEQARAESRADLDRTQATVFGLLDTLRSDVNRRLEALENRPGVARDIVGLNAGAALYAANAASSIAEGIGLARNAIESGAARAKLDSFVRTTQRLAGKKSM